MSVPHDQAWLDAQYNMRARHPDFQQHFDRWAARSDLARQALAGHLDLPYAQGAACTLDVFPAQAKLAPLAVFIHGGYWRSLDKNEHRFLAEPLVRAGCTVVNVNYPLAPQASLDEIVASCRAAVAWTYRHGAEYQGDVRRIYVAGHSAGGHLAAMLVSTDWPAHASLPADVLKGGCAISGLYDLDPVRRSYLNADLHLSEESAARNSPLRHLPAKAAPLILAVGLAESGEFVRQTADYAQAWLGRGLTGQHLQLPGLDHFSILDHFAQPGGALQRAFLTQIGLE